MVWDFLGKKIERFGCDTSTATSSAFVQLRKKILPLAIEKLFQDFVSHTFQYDYKINFSVSVHICRKFLLKANILPDIESLIAGYIMPIRPGRSRPRDMKSNKQ